MAALARLGILLSLGAFAVLLLAASAVAENVQREDEVLPAAREGTAAVWTGDRALVMGGRAGSGTTLLSEVLVHDPAEGSIEFPSYWLPSPRARMGAAWNGTAAIVAGGYLGFTQEEGYRFLDEILVVDPAAGTVETMADTMDGPVEAPAVVAVGEDVYVLGGWSGSFTIRDIQRFDAQTRNTTDTGWLLPHGVTRAAAVFDPTPRTGCPGGCIYVFGGTSHGTSPVIVTPTYYRDITRIDVATGVVTTLAATIPDPSESTSAVWTGSVAYVFSDADVLRFDPADGSLVKVATLPVWKSGTSAVWAGDAAYLYGGNNGGADVLRFGLEPAAPRDLRALWNADGAGALLTWQPPALVDGEPAPTGWRVYRSATRGAVPELVATIDDASAVDPYDATKRRFADTGLTNGVLYFYEVRAVNERGVGAPAAAMRPTYGIDCATMTSYAGPCFGVVQPGTAKSHSWGLWRSWLVDVELELHTPGSATVQLGHAGTTLDSGSVTGPGEVHLTDGLVSYPNRYDRLLTGFVNLTFSGSAPIEYSLVATKTPNSADDCGMGDSSPEAPHAIPLGVWCAGNMVDGWNDTSDAYAVEATDGDVVTFEVATAGRSYRADWRDPADQPWNGIESRVLRPPGYGTPTATMRHVAVANGTHEVELSWETPEEVGYWSCGGWSSCYWVVTDTWDAASVAPFTHQVRATVVENDRPVVGSVTSPAFAFDGDVVAWNVTVTDPDNDTVRPAFRVGRWVGSDWVWDALASVTPSSGPSGTTFRAVARLTPGTTQYVLEYDAIDTKDVHAFQADGPLWYGPPWSRVDVLQADCGAGRADAPAEGRLFSGSCAGSVHATHDAQDLLLFDAPAGKRVVLETAGAVTTVVRAPDGVERSGASYRDFASAAGRYEVRVTPTGASQDAYTVSVSFVSVVPPPTGTLALDATTATIVSDGAFTRTAGAWLTNVSHSATRTLDVPAEALAGATEARLLVYATRDACPDMTLAVNGAQPQPFRACDEWPETGDGWGSLDVPPAILRAGANDFRLQCSDDCGYKVGVAVLTDSTYDIDRSAVSWWTGTWTLGELLWRLELRGPVSASLPAPLGVPVELALVADDAETLDASGAIAWGDGATSTQALPWRATTVLSHAYGSSGAHLVEATATTANATMAASRAIDVGPAPDCGTSYDAPAWGLAFQGSCSGTLGAGDAEDVLLAYVPRGSALVLTASGAPIEVTAPAGASVREADGTWYAYSPTSGPWRIRLAGDAAGPATPYSVTVGTTAMAPPTGRVDASAKPFVALGDAWQLRVDASDLSTVPVAVTVDWGDGNATRYPGTGFAPPGVLTANLTHAYGSTGAFAVVVTGETLDGRALAAATRSLDVVVPDDCGAGEAPGTYATTSEPMSYVEGPPQLPAGPCYGALTEGDVDWYALDTPVGGNFTLRIKPGQGLAVRATIYGYSVGGVPGFSGTYYGRNLGTDAEGTVTLDQGAIGVSTGRYLLKIERASGTGAYQVAWTARAVVPGL